MTYAIIALWMLFVSGEPLLQNRAYINTYSMLAIAEQHRTGIPAAITMAQALHESGAGKGDLATRSNNHFGIKCKTNWTGPKVYHDDDERGECFRAYGSVDDSYRDHSDFLRQNTRYAVLFDCAPEDYRAWATGLKRAGYATNPRYAEILIKTIEDNGLQQLTLLALQAADTNALTSAVAFDSAAIMSDANQLQQPMPNLEFDKRPVEAEAATLPPQLDDFPDGIFSINGCKVVFLQQTTSLLAVAQRHGITLGDLLRFNDLPPQTLVGSNHLIFLERKKPKAAEAAFNTINDNTNLWQISQQLGVRLSVLVQANPAFNPKQPLPIGTVVSLSSKTNVESGTKR